MTIINAVGNSLTGQTGRGEFVGSVSPILTDVILGTPLSGDLTNCTGLPPTGLSSSTGNGSVVLSNEARIVSPFLKTPHLGAATATQLTFSPPTNGIVGRFEGENVSPGFIGENLSVFNVADIEKILVNDVAMTICNLTLTGGDWDVYLNFSILPQQDTTLTYVNGCISLIADTLVGDNDSSNAGWFGSYLGDGQTSLKGLNSKKRILMKGPINLYAVVIAKFTGTGCVAWGGLEARRH